MGSQRIPEILNSIFCSQRLSVEESLVHFCISDKSVLQCWSSFSCLKHCKIQSIINKLLMLEPRSCPIKKWWNFRSGSTCSCPLIYFILRDMLQPIICSCRIQLCIPAMHDTFQFGVIVLASYDEYTALVKSGNVASKHVNR